MNSKLTLAAVIAVALAGCGHRPPPGALAGHHGGPEAEHGDNSITDNIAANSFFGANNITVLSHSCAGRVRLDRGSAQVNDTCFTGDTNVVICSDASAPNPVMCSARKGALAIAGSSSDEINFARVR